MSEKRKYECIVVDDMDDEWKRLCLYQEQDYVEIWTDTHIVLPTDRVNRSKMIADSFEKLLKINK
tara:strand:+ start:156 stop:350 length:195 start_codon:yes stop_codon:yes gene_type:complete